MTDYLVARLAARRRRGERIVALTAYDYFTALLARAADADLVLVGDSLGNVVQGRTTTVPVTLREMVYHTRIVCRHVTPERVVLDLPFGSFKLDATDTVRRAARAFKAAGCGGVKLEGADASNLVAIRRLTAAGVPVVGHLGLLPQRVHADGGYRMQGKTAAQAAQLEADAQALAEAGACCVVLECVVDAAARGITEALPVPTIGIGSGDGCSGEIAVIHDVLGMLPGQAPSFAARYADLWTTAQAAAEDYAAAVRGSAKSDKLGDNSGQTPGQDPASLYGSAS